ncbi:hypothetical protein L873DRAFT_1767248 [Choiromyces venosus 120613-1]|uniref:Transcription initiation factor TFIID subunit 4 n=1 Tax=Choiromyces venosus 120613-1 TaxID=1336337 RepID=A0A3N4JRQ8_9PEZI|nr:hypothetical protein L873DRAFT_1767248 [Choiromyces venosus 120613-1]
MSSFPSSPNPNPLAQYQSPQNAQNTPTPPGPHAQQQQQQQASSSMPPPSAPASKPTDPTDLADALTSAGIDLKEEEARLHVESNVSSLPEDQAIRIVQRRYAESRANHLNNPFLETPVLANRLSRKTREAHCQQFSLTNNAGQVMTTGTQADTVALLSLAARERVNQILTRAIVLARSRRKATNVVIGDWADAVKDAALDNQDSTIMSPHTINLKRSFSAIGGLLPTPVLPPATTTLANETAKALRKLQQDEYAKELERLHKKAKKSGDAIPGQLATGAIPSTPGTPSAMSFTESGPPTPGAAKESKKARETKLDDAQTHRAANTTANLMMSKIGFGHGKRKKTYAWMANHNSTAGASALATRRAVDGDNLGGSVSSAGASGGGQQRWNGGQRLGAWREDGERGGGVQMRDWIGALEGDGRGIKKGLVKSYLQMK